MSGDVLVRLRTMMSNLPRAEQAIARRVLDDPGATAEMTISELAQLCGTSETTVTRFCRSIGLRGYAQLRLHLAAEAERLRADDRADTALGGDIGRDDSLTELIKKVGFADARAVEDTVAHLDVSVLDALVTAILSATRIDVYGVGSTATVAQDAAYKLHRAGRPAAAWSDVHAALMSASTLTTGDVALAISHSGRTREILDALAEAKRRGATTAVITSNPQSPAAELAGLVLTTAARETTFRSGGTASRTAQLTVVDCIYVALSHRRYDESLEAMERAHDAVRGHVLPFDRQGR
ncbi:MurR/RpiR family transcriptional regulator [Dactylosporangium aurantiacum]|uniref:MurR/RpiR family transcriptional regulator n=1 Tax=Dactylosporangium aurantiacum TaxID=35754 RepID=A0A9Q9I7M5_9ACTN|nr:MurR/RpiR family transcriptional regulator [Dactylosporangium aurantiacum]MDG6107310.1 MurR/RpiR family transcriptional regulator [Dactylosporangium aurantiacum]UWZ51164.1 MurR/RpiR family transcriptional regulator [Dactylosporangium aurantiacum]